MRLVHKINQQFFHVYQRRYEMDGIDMNGGATRGYRSPHERDLLE